MLTDQDNASKRAAQRFWLRLTILALLCCLVSLVGGAVLFARQAETTLAQITRQAQLSLQLRELQAVLVNLTDAETGQRGYLLTGRERYLQPYRHAVSLVPGLLQGLEAIQTADPSLRERIAQVRRLAQAKFAELAQTLELFDSGQKDSAIALVASDAGQHTMEEVRAEIEGLLAVLRHERDSLNSAIAAGAERSRQLLVLAVSLFVLFVAVGGGQIVLLLRARRQFGRALRELTAIFHKTPDYIMQADWRGRINYINPAMRQLLGLRLDEPVGGRLFSEFSTPETNEMLARVIVPAVRTDGVWLGEATIYAAGKQVVPVSHMVIAHSGKDGRVTRYSAVMRNIAAEVEARQRLRDQTATLQAITEAIPAIVAVVGNDQRLRFVNSAFERWAGVTRDQVVGSSLEQVLGSADYGRTQPWVERVLQGESVSFERDYPLRSEARHLAMTYIPLRMADGVLDGFVGIAQDITHHREEAVRLLQLSERDALTGLLNRAGFEHYLQRVFEQGGAATLALLYVDLDHFKPVNDTHGHPVGDELLRQFAQRLQRLVRPTDAVARIGGDEFAIVLSGVRERQTADMVADKIVDAAHTPFDVGALSLRIGASVGMAWGASDEQGWQGLITRADAMLYQAKSRGRGRKA